MHLALIIALVLYTALFRRKDLKNWKKYHATMLFTSMGNLLYNFIYSNHLLWKLNPDILWNHMVGEIFYTFIIFPLTALIYLSRLPDDRIKKIIYTAKYIIVYIILEWIFDYYDRILYNYGWNIGWSLAWDCMMFPMWALHYKKPLKAYLCSILAVLVVLILFPLK